jgi:hypothetical protein
MSLLEKPRPTPIPDMTLTCDTCGITAVLEPPDFLLPQGWVSTPKHVLLSG